MLKNLTFFLILATVLFGCSQEEIKTETLTKSVETNNLTLKVTAPAIVKKGERFKVEGVITYTGKETVELSHGKPVILFVLAGKKPGSEDVLWSTTMEPGKTLEATEYFELTNTGEYDLQVRTSIIFINGEVIEGVGNEAYIKNVSSENREQENSKLSLVPIKIKVK
jgi:hypothetical protein